MNNNSTYITLYPNIIPVRGYGRSVLMDLYMGKFLFIPNYFCDFLLENQSQKLQWKDFVNIGDSESDQIEITELVKYLIEADILVEVDPDLLEGLSVEHPTKTEDSLINDCIIELSAESNWNLGYFLSEIDRIGVKFLEIRFLDFEAFEEFRPLIQLALQQHAIEFLHMIVPFATKLDQILMSEMLDFRRLNQLTIYDSPVEFRLEGVPFQINFSTQANIDHSTCGCVDPAYFGYNAPSYYDKRKNNSCLSHKLSIDQYGDIRNCPSKKDSFGKLSDIDLERTIRLKEFQKEWHITKESILICSECEFRWMCSDCRVFIQDESNPLSKPSKCGYNPFISLWKDEENYLSEQDCGIYIENGIISIPEERINEINERIWG